MSFSSSFSSSAFRYQSEDEDVRDGNYTHGVESANSICAPTQIHSPFP